MWMVGIVPYALIGFVVMVTAHAIYDIYSKRKSNHLSRGYLVMSIIRYIIILICTCYAYVSLGIN